MNREAFQRESQAAFIRFAATLRMALISSSEAERNKPSVEVMEKLNSVLSASQMKVLKGHLKSYGESLFHVANSAENEKANFHIRVNLDNIRDPEVRAGFRLVRQDVFSLVSPVSNTSYALQAAVVAVVSAFEVFAVQMLSKFYILHPGAISGNPQIPLMDAVSLASIDEVLERAATKAAHSELEAPFEDWIGLLAKHAGVDLKSRPNEWPGIWKHLGRTFALRNCLIHAGGRIDDRFRQRWQKYGIALPGDRHEIGATLDSVMLSVRSALVVGSQIYYGLCRKQAAPETIETDIRRLRGTLSNEFLEFVRHGHEDAIEALDEELPFWRDYAGSPDILQAIILGAIFISGRKEAAKALSASLPWPEHGRLVVLKAALGGDVAHLIETIRAALSSKSIGLTDVLYSSELFVVRRIVSKQALRDFSCATHDGSEVVEADVDVIVLEADD